MSDINFMEIDFLLSYLMIISTQVQAKTDISLPQDWVYGTLSLSIAKTT